MKDEMSNLLTLKENLSGGKHSYLFIFIYFKQYEVRGAQFSKAGLNRALMKQKKKHTHTRQIKIKKMVQLSIRN